MEITIEQEKAKPKLEWYQIVPKQYHEYSTVFQKETFDKLPQNQPIDHAIDLKPGTKPVNCKIYPLSPSEQVELDKFLKENLSTE